MSQNTLVVEMARYLRQEMTKVEKILWIRLRKKQFNGLKFRRQMPLVIGGLRIVADFYCPKHKLIIELDGKIHNLEDVKEYDELKEERLQDEGFRVLRFNNKEVIENLDLVLKKILKILSI